MLSALPRGRLALVLGLMMLAALTEGLGLLLMARALGALDGKPVPVLTALGLPSGLGPLLVAAVALVTLRAAVLYARSVLSQRLGFELVDGLRRRCMGLLLNAEWRVLSAMRQSDNASLLITNIDRVFSAYTALIAALAAAVLLAGAGLTALALAPPLALLMALGGALALWGYRSLRRRARTLGEHLGTANDEVYARIDENLNALRLIKALRAERRATDRVAQGFAALREVELATLRSFALSQGALQVGAAAVLALALWLAVERLGVATATVLPLVALFARTVPLIGQVQESWQAWLHASPALVAVEQLTHDLEDAAEPPADPAMPAPRLASALTFKDVSLSHDGRAKPALDGVSLDLHARRTTALVGPSGAGKSTLADLVCGLTAPDSGTVLIDGAVLDGAARRAWRGAVAYVQQDPVVFHASIRENLTWATPAADDSAMIAALKAASASFVLALPQGLDTVVGDRGARLSGGERQRIALARALLCQPQLLVLDEATSALDSANEAAIAEAMTHLSGQMTILVICHRGALAALADRVITLDGGKVVAIKGLDGGPEDVGGALS